jgi:hypothetical protein
MLVFERTGYDSWKTSKMVEHFTGLGWTLAQFEPVWQTRKKSGTDWGTDRIRI